MIYKINLPSDKVKIIEVIQNLSDGKKWEVSVKIKREFRSVSQNRLMWLWIACICDETGSDRDEVHLELGLRYLPLKIVKGLSGNKEKPISTTTLDTAQFKAYLDKIQVFALRELGITLPLPEDLIFASFLEKYKNYI